MRTSTATRSSVTLTVWDDPVLRFAAAHAVLIGVLLACAAAHLGLVATTVLAVLAMAWVARRLPAGLRPALGLITWAFVTGFVVNEDGLLTFATADLHRLVVVVASTWALAGAFALPGRVRNLRR